MIKPYKTPNSGRRTAHRQRGNILLLSLLILLLLTILGVNSMSGVTMQERMAGNLRDGELALQAAEAALRSGENWLGSQTIEPATCTTINSTCDTVWAAGILSNLDYQDPGWWNTNGRDYANSGGGAFLTGGDISDNGPHANDSFVTAPPKFIIHFQNFVRDSSVVGHSNRQEGNIYYIITAHGFGGTTEAESVLQTAFTKRF